MLQTNEEGELFESRIVEVAGVRYLVTEFFADDRHEDISHCHLRTETDELEK